MKRVIYCVFIVNQVVYQVVCFWKLLL